jgi:kynurenine--oxoglutarate transaminase/cysteine-S-conjugate beta-lyase/glutamine--phenylpyruvate transaminase
VVHNNSIYCCPTFFQEVIGRCFELELSRLNKPESYFKSIVEELKPKRDRLAKLLLDIGLTPVIPEGGYFMLADISKIAKDFHSDSEMKDSKFVKYLIKEKVNNTIVMNLILMMIIWFQYLFILKYFKGVGHDSIYSVL